MYNYTGIQVLTPPMSVLTPKEEGGGFGVGRATQPCKKVLATEMASSTVSQIY